MYGFEFVPVEGTLLNSTVLVFLYMGTFVDVGEVIN